MTLLVSLCAVAGFGVGLWITRVAATARSAIDQTMAGVSAMLDPELDDDSKEVAVRRAGLGLIGAAFHILWRFSIVLALAAAPILLADALGLVSSDAVLSLMLRLDYIAVVSGVAIAALALIRRLSRSSEASPQANRYSATDRFFHYLAFSSPAVLRGASRLEDRLVTLPEAIHEKPPIFVTSLARGGTTALLNALHDVPGVATHVYRDMPFLTAPLLWNRITGGGRRQVERYERAHGDGLNIDLDSPEAFEEVLWKMFWPEKFRTGTIGLWAPEDRKSEAEAFIKHHMTKVIHTRHRQSGFELGEGVYCSKNNTNIARIPYLVDSFPNCRLLIPLRRPDTHAASLHRQHQNFLQQQDTDPFIRRYMGDIGHFEFGQIHKPIAFPGFDRQKYNPATPDYWLNYWAYAFEHIRQYRDRCLFVLQDDLRERPQDTMSAVLDYAGLAPGQLDFTSYFRSGRDKTDRSVFAPDLLERADLLYHELTQSAILR